jgi:sucrose-6-phosphate hydrolase SacC (GH32 family)
MYKSVVLGSLSLLSLLSAAYGAEHTVKIQHRYLHFPVSHSVDRVRMTLRPEKGEAIPINIRLTDGTPDYWVFKDVENLKGKRITIEVPDHLKDADIFRQADTIPDQSLIYHEANRPQFHFTTRRGWINDPNGLIWHDGEYHLFYQHNPYERDWENMHWGHAVSTDLIHWQELPTALHPDALGTMFSGTAVIDHDNDSGFGKKSKPAMVAAYTIAAPGRQMQGIAYSLDNGRTFTKYEGNPVIDSKEKWESGDTRDPKVFKHGDHWVMVLNERDGHSFYTSANLRDWEYKSHVTGFWECPDLFELPVDGNPQKKLWVMYGASGTYMLGNFDGETFTPVSGKHRYTAGTGYAAQTFNNIPDSDGRRIQISWSRIGHPGMNFNGMMLLPTELTLRTTKDGPRLASKPVKEEEQLCHSLGRWENLTQEQANEIIRRYNGSDRLRIRLSIELSHATDASLSLGRQRLIDYDMNGNTLNGWFYSPQDPTSMTLDADLYIDRTSAEVFVEDGLFSYSLGRDLNAGTEFSLNGNRLRVPTLEIFAIDSIWP